MRFALAAFALLVAVGPGQAAGVEMAPPGTAVTNPQPRPPSDQALCLPASQSSILGPAAEKFCQAAWAEERAAKPNEMLVRFIARYGNCYTLSDLAKAESDLKGAFDQKPAADWTGQDLVGALRYDMRCRHQVFTERPLDEGRPDPQSVSAVYHNIVAQVAQAKLEKANAQAAMQANERATEEREDRERRHVAELTTGGYREMSVSHFQLDGRSLVGRRVAIRGFVFVIDDRHARVSSNSDDLSGVPLDVSSGNRDVRRFLFAHCSSLSNDCLLEVKATVVELGSRIGLQLD